MHTSTVLTFLALAFAASFLPVLVLARWTIWKRRLDTRRPPLTTELQHLPGDYERSKAERLMEEINDRILLAALLGPLVLTAWALVNIDLHAVRVGWFELILLLVIAATASVVAQSGLKRARMRRNYLDGYDAERATAQELALLTGKDCVIYHDVLSKNDSNIDHIVIGSSKVFTIETKSRRKPDKGGNQSAQVQFDGALLRFPNWQETKPLDQARAEARWLSKYLYRKTGEHVIVEPVLALPGWYVTVTSPKTDVHVINPKNHDFMATKSGNPISGSQRRRIMTAIEERYQITQSTAELDKQNA